MSHRSSVTSVGVKPQDNNSNNEQQKERKENPCYWDFVCDL